MSTHRGRTVPHTHSALLVLVFFILITMTSSMNASATSYTAVKPTPSAPQGAHELKSLDAEVPPLRLSPRGRWGDGSHRYAPARFTYRAPTPEEKPPVLIATKPLPSNRPNPKPHAKGYKGYLKKLHSTQRTVRGRFPFKLKLTSTLGAYGKKNGKVRPLTYETADFNWESKYKDVKFLHREDRP